MCCRVNTDVLGRRASSLREWLKVNDSGRVQWRGKKWDSVAHGCVFGKGSRLRTHEDRLRRRWEELLLRLNTVCEMLKSLTETFICCHWEAHASKQWQESIGGEMEQKLCVYLFARWSPSIHFPFCTQGRRACWDQSQLLLCKDRDQPGQI